MSATRIQVMTKNITPDVYLANLVFVGPENRQVAEGLLKIIIEIANAMDSQGAAPMEVLRDVDGILERARKGSRGTT
jgi:hypothetical protein